MESPVISILTHEPVPTEAQPPGISQPVQVPAELEEDARVPEPADEPSEEFEIVLGRRQVAGVLFVATVIVVIFSAFSYLAGEMASPRKAAPAAAAQVPTPVATPAPAIQPDPLLQADVTTEAPPKPEAPLFANPKIGSVYLQMGAVEKGIGLIFAEGLRKHGFDSFVAPGPNDHIFRVLIGPLRNPQEFERTKQAVDQLGIGTFGKKYVQDATSSSPQRTTP